MPPAGEAGRATGRSGHSARRQMASLIAPRMPLGAMAMPTACAACGRSLARYGDPRHLCCRRCTTKAEGDVARTPPDECRECGKKFHARTRSVKYCSDACGAAGNRRINAASQRRYMADPEKRAMSLARSRALSAARTTLAHGGGGQLRRSRVDSRTAARSPRRAKRPEVSACGLCGRTFEQYAYRRTNYCKRCRARIDRKINAVLAVDCKVCGKRFFTKSPLAKYCSLECRNAVRNRRRRVATAGARPTPRRTPE